MGILLAPCIDLPQNPHGFHDLSGNQQGPVCLETPFATELEGGVGDDLHVLYALVL